ncbi:hypothetical protein [Aminobacter aminovorans]|uniref:Peptidase M23 domain-containing protein n=1 Tax=Aminobacter aminovorans TaxID=83263 RepID=A0AAC9AS58_AMIAI|nr:hypothetical protein [Aminobacter aminovorans]AMS42885.1 hypothetical protein AA2016_3968 [Aminobacter aminovorans]MBB3704735.1 hypothetical protein [Aminobacter aminovorans]
MFAVVAVMSFVSLAVPLAFCWRLWRLDEPADRAWLLVLVESAVLVTLVVIVARWDIAGMWSRIALVGLFATVAAVSAWRHLRKPWLPADGSPISSRHIPALASVVVFGAALAYVMIGVFDQHDPRDFTFPLEGGHFVVAHGGTIGVLNHHSDHAAQRHALDFTAVNALGFPGIGAAAGRSRALCRLRQDGGQPVRRHDPCRGGRAARPCTTGGRPRQCRRQPCRGVLRRSQCRACPSAQGQRCGRGRRQGRGGAPIGQVGNSGNSTEPHLHIHAVDVASGTGVQMSFDDTIPVRNTLIIR